MRLGFRYRGVSRCPRPPRKVQFVYSTVSDCTTFFSFGVCRSKETWEGKFLVAILSGLTRPSHMLQEERKF